MCVKPLIWVRLECNGNSNGVRGIKRGTSKTLKKLSEEGGGNFDKPAYISGLDRGWSHFYSKSVWIARTRVFVISDSSWGVPILRRATDIYGRICIYSLILLLSCVCKSGAKELSHDQKAVAGRRATAQQTFVNVKAASAPTFLHQSRFRSWLRLRAFAVTENCLYTCASWYRSHENRTGKERDSWISRWRMIYRVMWITPKTMSRLNSSLMKYSSRTFQTRATTRNRAAIAITTVIRGRSFSMSS